jgi:hypothetical protein
MNDVLRNVCDDCRVSFERVAHDLALPSASQSVAR